MSKIYDAKKLEVFPGRRCYVQITAEMELCASCERPMLPTRRFGFDRGLDPGWTEMRFEKQAQRAGWARYSGFSNGDGDHVCNDCADRGAAKFKCALCGEERPQDHAQESFGDPPEWLCRPCYETRTAKEYEEKRQRLEEAHRWDFD